MPFGAVEAPATMRFTVEQPDYRLSPFTGMTRRHWVASAELLLAGVFSHLKDAEAPLVFPRRSAVAYPQPGAPAFMLRAEELEGLARTFLVAAPLLEERPGLVLHGWNVRDYYAQAILRACDPRSAGFVGWPEELARESGGKPAQQLVEMAGLCVGLMSARGAIWERYTTRERESVLACLSRYATAPTHPHNWRFFNVLIGAFLEREGCAVDEAKMAAHLDALMAYCAGDGWYRDGREFDYYSAWAFQFYGPLWCAWTGYRTRPELAALIERRHGELMANYPYCFGRGGESLVWGRSAIYRCAASAPLVVAFKIRTTPLDPGWARRMASGNLLQFLGRAEFWQEGIPSLGFYGPQDAVLQGYSCAASPFWLGKIYQALSLPGDSPFWEAVENEGFWPGLGSESRTVVMPGAGLTATANGANGTAECRSGKVTQAQGWYQRLAFNSAFPWEADDSDGGVAMSYAWRRFGDEGDAAEFVTPAVMRFGGMKEGVLYRQLRFPATEEAVAATIDLAEILLPDGGVLRVDRARLRGRGELHLGHYGLPCGRGGEPRSRSAETSQRRTLTARSGRRAVLLTAYAGWTELRCRKHVGKSVEAATSVVVHAVHRQEQVETAGVWLVALLRQRTDGAEWSEAEEDPGVELIPEDSGEGMRVRFKDGSIRRVDFLGFEDTLQN